MQLFILRVCCPDAESQLAALQKLKQIGQELLR